MRKRADWMVKADEIILEILEGGLMLGPTAIAKNGDLSRQHVTNRLSILVAYEFVERVEDGYYRITDRGRLWLEGEIDASELEPK
ncbi:winged helix-turn-helix domain-containing protein [Natrinema pallidum]|uniref:PhiH1 repressor-like protein n=2 Tax=Natrinema pallidum TaxID=69527 RepID=L9Z3X4_9EURY|nr:winged helix-turn-helix domain-containing protein [Natrinema pallidum]ELY79883.1 PhiH1 repressor-like protein [Natrinema pallidum DSM 3751]QCW02247.1 transcriptional regulator [Natrinema pallidum]